MDIIDKLHMNLIEREFNLVDGEEFYSLGATYYTDRYRNVFIKVIDYDIDKTKIEEYCYNLRELLLGVGVNIWNSYILFCINNKTIDEKLYLIERDNKYLRKYVVASKEDINRIPFLDDSTQNEIDYISNEGKRNDYKDDKFISNILNLIKENGGENAKFNNKDIRELTKKILSLEGLKYED